jgi:hypothetical protein
LWKIQSFIRWLIVVSDNTLWSRQNFPHTRIFYWKRISTNNELIHRRNLHNPLRRHLCFQYSFWTFIVQKRNVTYVPTRMVISLPWRFVSISDNVYEHSVNDGIHTFELIFFVLGVWSSERLFVEYDTNSFYSINCCWKEFLYPKPQPVYLCSWKITTKFSDSEDVQMRTKQFSWHKGETSATQTKPNNHSFQKIDSSHSPPYNNNNNNSRIPKKSGSSKTTSNNSQALFTLTWFTELKWQYVIHHLEFNWKFKVQ